MPFTDAALTVMVDAEAGAATWISAHTADPGTTGANQTGSRAQTTWGSAGTGATGGDRVGSQVTIAIGAGVTVTHWGLNSAASGGTFHGGWPLGTAETFGSAGSLLHTPTLDVDAV
jgi:hypothetical protein